MNNISIENDVGDDSPAPSETESAIKVPTKTPRRRGGPLAWSHVKKTRRFTLFRKRQSARFSTSCETDAQKVETSLQESTDENRATDGGTKICKQQSDEGAVTKAVESCHEYLPVNLSPREGEKLWKDGRLKGILTVTLLNGTDLPAMDENGLSDPYCKLRLGPQKHKSKVKVKTLNPQWKEKFDFKVFEGDDTLSIEVWSRNFVTADHHLGSCKVELGTLVPDKTYDLTLPLVDSGCGSIHLLLCLSGMAVNEMDECDGPQNDVTEESYGLISLLRMKPINDVGCLKAKIGGVSELNIGENSSLFAVLRVGNSEFRTDVVHTCANVIWNKTFYFNINDIHDDLEVSVICKRKSYKNELVGKVIIPLLRLGAITTKMYALKDKHSMTKAKAGGVVDLECDLVYNPIRAGIRTFLPKEGRVMGEEEETFKRKVMISNIRRAMDVGSILQSMWSFIEGLWNWEDKWLSALCFFFFVVACLLAEVWMVFPLLILLLLYGYMVVYVRGHHLWQIDSRRKSRHRDGDDEEESSMEELEGSELEDEGDPAAEDQSKAGISQKFKQLQRGLLLLQTLLGQLADLGERVQNFCHWRVPWLCWLAITVLTIAMVIVYFIPLRYIILAWGVNKFTKWLRNPHYIDNQELLDFISRAPTNRQLLQWHELPFQTPLQTCVSTLNRRVQGHSLGRQMITYLRLAFFLIIVLQMIPVASGVSME
ncbi:hypothetical protein EMCRGX_G022302, partial [Ephydatia muelleri]